jgi:hypothetical protein
MVLLSEGPSGLLIGASGACNRGRRHALTLRVLYLYNVNRPPATSTENPTTSVVQYKHSTATISSQQTTTTASRPTTTDSTTCSHQLTTNSQYRDNKLQPTTHRELQQLEQESATHSVRVRTVTNSSGLRTSVYIHRH